MNTAIEALKKSSVPTTGVNINIALHSSLIAVSAAVLFVLRLAYKKRRHAR